MPRFFALWLTLGLALPSPALALRPEQSPKVKAGLEEALRGPAAGAEEGWLAAELQTAIGALDKVLGSEIFSRNGARRKEQIPLSNARDALKSHERFLQVATGKEQRLGAVESAGVDLLSAWKTIGGSMRLYRDILNPDDLDRILVFGGSKSWREAVPKLTGLAAPQAAAGAEEGGSKAGWMAKLALALTLGISSAYVAYQYFSSVPPVPIALQAGLHATIQNPEKDFGPLTMTVQIEVPKELKGKKLTAVPFVYTNTWYIEPFDDSRAKHPVIGRSFTVETVDRSPFLGGQTTNRAAIVLDEEEFDDFLKEYKTRGYARAIANYALGIFVVDENGRVQPVKHLPVDPPWWRSLIEPDGGLEEGRTVSPAAGAEERAALEEGRAKLNGFIQSMQTTIKALSPYDRLDPITPLTEFFPGLKDLLRDAGYEGVAQSVWFSQLPPGPLNSLKIKVFVEKGTSWTGQVIDNLSGYVALVESPEQADLIIGEDRSEIRIDPRRQAFLQTGAGTAKAVTLGLLKHLEDQGLLNPGSVVVLNVLLKRVGDQDEDVLLFA